MNDLKENLMEEQLQLEEKLDMLNAFNESAEALEIEKNEKLILRIQAGAMYTYNECLKSRIEKL